MSRSSLVVIATLAAHALHLHALEARSFVRRQGHCTKRQRRALRELWPAYGVDVPWNRTIDDVHALYGAPRARAVLDIGFGHGDSLAGMAAARPNDAFFGVEVHRPGVGSALLRCEERDLSNVRVARIDAFTLLRDHLAPRGGHFDECCVFFPDPWFKAKDEHRRLIRPAMLDLLAVHLKPGGHLHVATDVDGYARHVEATLAADDRFVEARRATDARPDWRPETQYERRGAARGHAITDLTFALR